ncbi:MAG: hypothetical protein H0X24_02640 [Ktedonobacterales bacterium]|nr:hypothetical protein [Ktedonobacterales bacterium]
MRETRDLAHTNTIYWLFEITDQPPTQTQTLIKEVHASRKMLERHQQDSAQGQSADERKLMYNEEGIRVNRLFDQLRESLQRDVHSGIGIFRGVTTNGGGLGKSAYESIRRYISNALPDIYPLFALGEYTVGNNDIEQFLRAHNLHGLPQSFYAAQLVIQQGPTSFIINPEADLAHEVLGYLNRQRAQNIAVFGKDLTAFFSEGPIYGWDGEVPKLALAALIRNGAIEITIGGKNIQSYTDPKVREVLTGAQAYRTASFAPHQPLDRKVIGDAYKVIEALSGKTPDDVNPLKIAGAARELVAQDRTRVHDALTFARAHQIPVIDLLNEYEGYLSEFAQGREEDIVKNLAEKGETIKQSRARAIRLVGMLTDENIATIVSARTVLHNQYAALAGIGVLNNASETATQLRAILNQPDLFESLVSIRDHITTLRTAYDHAYRDLHAQRTDRYREAIDSIQADPNWEVADVAQREAALIPLWQCVCQSPNVPLGEMACTHCHHDLKDLHRDVSLVAALRLEASAKVARAVPPLPLPTDDGPASEPARPRTSRTVQAATYFRAPLTTPTEVEAAVEQLRAALLNLVRDGNSVTVE